MKKSILIVTVCFFLIGAGFAGVLFLKSYCTKLWIPTLYSSALFNYKEDTSFDQKINPLLEAVYPKIAEFQDAMQYFAWFRLVWEPGESSPKLNGLNTKLAAILKSESEFLESFCTALEPNKSNLAALASKDCLLNKTYEYYSVHDQIQFFTILGAKAIELGNFKFGSRISLATIVLCQILMRGSQNHTRVQDYKTFAFSCSSVLRSISNAFYQKKIPFAEMKKIIETLKQINAVSISWKDVVKGEMVYLSKVELHQKKKMGNLGYFLSEKLIGKPSEEIEKFYNSFLELPEKFTEQDYAKLNTEVELWTKKTREKKLHPFNNQVLTELQINDSFSLLGEYLLLEASFELVSNLPKLLWINKKFGEKPVPKEVQNKLGVPNFFFKNLPLKLSPQKRNAVSIFISKKPDVELWLY